MNEDLDFLRKHRQRGALFDANLLLVYVVGKTGTQHLKQLHHTKQYVDDFPIVEELVEYFPIVYTTPNVLTEVSNLGRKLGYDFFDTLRRVVDVLKEDYCVSRDAVGDTLFRKLGLTDSGLLTVASKVLIVTADFPLYIVIRSRKLDVVNFNHLRPVWAQGQGPL